MTRLMDSIIVPKLFVVAAILARFCICGPCMLFLIAATIVFFARAESTPCLSVHDFLYCLIPQGEIQTVFQYGQVIAFYT